MSRKYSATITGKMKGETVPVIVSHIAYRDSKGRFTKFTKKKKIAQEVYYKIKSWNKRRRSWVYGFVKIKKHSTKLQYRKRKISYEEMATRIYKKSKAPSSHKKWVDGLLTIETPQVISKADKDKAKRDKELYRQRKLQSTMSVHTGSKAQHERERIEKLMERAQREHDRIEKIIMSRNKNL